jgi:hypothetical protein
MNRSRCLKPSCDKWLDVVGNLNTSRSFKAIAVAGTGAKTGGLTPTDVMARGAKETVD